MAELFELDIVELFREQSPAPCTAVYPGNDLFNNVDNEIFIL